MDPCMLHWMWVASLLNGVRKAWLFHITYNPAGAHFEAHVHDQGEWVNETYKQVKDMSLADWLKDRERKVKILQNAVEMKEELIKKLVDVIIDYNSNKVYKSFTCNSQHFVLDALTALGIKHPPKFHGRLGEYLKSLKHGKKHAPEEIAQGRTVEAERITAQLQEEIHRAKHRAQEAEQKVQESEKSLQESERRAMEAERSNVQLQEEKHRAQHRARQAEQRVQESEQRLQESEQRLQNANQQVQKLTTRVQRLESQWVVKRREIEFTVEELGRGGWAAVNVANFRGIRVAAKCFYKEIVSSYNRRLFTREMNMAACIRHPNLVQFVGATLEEAPIILMELMSTSLRSVLKLGPVSRDQIVSISRDVARALNYLHLMQPDPIIHRDISSANVLLDPLPNNQWKAKISDYGSVNLLQDQEKDGRPNAAAIIAELNEFEI